MQSGTRILSLRCVATTIGTSKSRIATCAPVGVVQPLPRTRNSCKTAPLINSKKGTVMRLKIILLSLMAFGSTAAFTDLEPWKDYSMSESVWTVTAIKVHSNMGDAYLEGLKKTWIASNEVAEKLGQIEEYHLYRSDFQDSGTFNLLLVVKFKNNEALAPTKARYDAFMKEWGAERNKKTTDIAQHEYLAMRDITANTPCGKLHSNSHRRLNRGLRPPWRAQPAVASHRPGTLQQTARFSHQLLAQHWEWRPAGRVLEPLYTTVPI